MVEKGLAESREKAKAMVMAGLVQVNGQRMDKAGHAILSDAAICVKRPLSPYVSRGGLKLEAAIRHFSVDVTARMMLDVGASTGGFTDCLLQFGAEKVIAVDVGYGQLDWKLRQDGRVQVLERTNIRSLKPEDLHVIPDGAVIDTAFISLKQVAPPVMKLLKARAFIIALIKPQFEVGKGRVGKGGVVRNAADHRWVIEDLTRFFLGLGWTIVGHTPSPLLGPKGNREFLIYMTREGNDSKK